MRQSNNILKGLSLIIGFTSCVSTKHLSSKYCMVSSSSNITTLSFSSNATYVGYSSSDVAGQFITRGKWLKNSDTLFLIPDRYSLIDSKEITSTNTDDTSVIKFIDIERSRPIEGIIVRVGNKIFETAENGEVVLNGLLPKILYISYMNLHDEVLSADISGKTVNINIDFRKMNTFNVSRIWLIRKRKIIPIEKGFTEFKECK